MQKQINESNLSNYHNIDSSDSFGLIGIKHAKTGEGGIPTIPVGWREGEILNGPNGQM